MPEYDREARMERRREYPASGLRGQYSEMDSKDYVNSDFKLLLIPTAKFFYLAKNLTSWTQNDTYTLYLVFHYTPRSQSMLEISARILRNMYPKF